MDEKFIKMKIQEGRDFMKNNSSDDEDYESDQMKKLPQPPLVKANMREVSISLPTDFSALEIENDFLKVINRRKSSRVYTQESISLLQLSFLLWVSQGVKEIRGKSYATLRTVPSGGARHPFETYLLVLNVEGLKPGKYHYLPMKHELEYLGECENMSDVISNSLCEQSWTSKASVVFYYSIQCYRCEWRYGMYAHRPALIDAGHMGQNLYLACSALNLGTCGIAAFDNKICDPLFEMDGEEEFTVYTFPVGTISKNDQEKEDAFYAFVREEGL